MASSKPIYADRGSRISKENLCMVIALWMGERPLQSEEDDSYHKVGAVLVRPDEMIHTVDCSRDGVHGIARLMIKHYDVAKDCKVFVSRKPCSFCAKLLVQSKVKRVFYLPIKPEYIAEDEILKEEMSRVDNLFKTSCISQSVFVPKVGKEVFANAEKLKETPKDIRDKIKRDRFIQYWTKEGTEDAKNYLPWPAFDENMKKQVQGDFEETMEWMARILIGVEKGYTVKQINATSKNGTVSFDPERNEEHKTASLRFITLAQFLAERSDDPKTGVGAVIIDEAQEILALGWNGFPSKALYGEFPRASHDDNDGDNLKKYPYMIHAEQNALLMRNTKSLTHGILFVTKTPCDECTPLIEMEGIKTVILGQGLKIEKGSDGKLSYSKFAKKVEAGVFNCFEMKITDNKPPPKKAVQNLSQM